MSEFDINHLISRIDSLPTLPTVYYRLLDVMNNPRSTAVNVADVICKDQASASKVLKAANSPIYGFYGKIQNITQAITYIGFEEVKNLVTAITIIDFFSDKFTNQYINPIEFWKHSISVGILSRLIGKQIKASDLESYFLAGILHDIGKILFINLMPELYSKVIQYSIENKVQHKDAEIKMLGITHNVVGELLANKWNLPNSIKNAVRYHESGNVDNSYKDLVASVHIANMASLMYGFGVTDEVPIPEPNKNAWELLQLSENFFTSSYPLMLSSYNDTVNLLIKQIQ